MTANHAHTPREDWINTEWIRSSAITGKPMSGATFDRWLSARDARIRAAAEQRGAARALRDVMEVHQKTEHQRAYGFPRADKWEHYCMEDNQSWPCPTVQAITDAMNGATNA